MTLTNTHLTMTLADIQREIAALPPVLSESDEAVAGDSSSTISEPLQIVSKQGRLILRLSAAMEALEGRYRELAEAEKGRKAQVDSMGDSLRESGRHARQTALEAIHLMDALDWTEGAARAQGNTKLADQIVSAQRDCLRRLAAVGVTEIPAARGAAMDGRLHEGVDAVSASGEDADIPRYHILSLVRRGYQYGTDILRRAEVITAA